MKLRSRQAPFRLTLSVTEVRASTDFASHAAGYCFASGRATPGAYNKS